MAELCAMDVIFLGSGNVATVLAKMAVDRGHRVAQVYSRSLLNAEELADTVGAAATNRLEAIGRDADLYVSALSDAATLRLPTTLRLLRGVLVHTAGALPVETLEPCAINVGVLYPLQSLRKQKIDYEPFPLLTQANNSDALALVNDFAESLSPVVKSTNNAERLQLHVAAVIANNFSNHLFALAEQYCLQHQLSFDLLKPLIVETATRVVDHAPSQMQTGPAMRGDLVTIATHLNLLGKTPALAQLYATLSASIAGMHGA
jgi:predicted short-subunit dehydrogenase-like oxidoreductase (DUF2520 family)